MSTKIGTPPPSSTKIQSKNSTSMSQLRASSKAKESQTPTQRPSRAKSVTPDVNNGSDSRSIRRALLLNKPKSGELVLGCKVLEEVKVVGGVRPGKTQVGEQFAKPRRQRPVVEANCKSNEDDPHRKMKELKEKIEVSESLITNLQAEVLGLKAELDKEQGFNMELQLQNKKLTENLAAAEAKIAALTTPQQVKT